MLLALFFVSMAGIAYPKNEINIQAVPLGEFLPGWSAIPTAINNKGVVAGWSDSPDGPVPFLWTEDGGFEPVPGIAHGFLWDINDRGELIGIELTDSGVRSFYWSQATGIVDLGSFAPSEINNRGQIVGQCGFPTQACLLADGVVHEVGLMAGALNSFGFGLNDRGQVVGSAIRPQDEGAFVWSEKSGFVPLPGDEFSAAMAINDKGEIAGGICCPSAVVWSTKRLEIVRQTAADGGAQGEAINSRGWVAGTRVANGGRAMLWLPDGRVVDLPVDAELTSTAAALNDRGQIVGSSLDASGVSHGVLWIVRHAH